MDSGIVPTPHPPSDLPPAGRPAGPLRILLVEDNKDIARVLASLLSRSGYLVTTAGGVAEAERLAASSGPFDLLISDLSLPDGSGLELIRHIGPMPGIAVSGYSTEIDLQECLSSGFVDLLAKPVLFSDLDAVIRRMFG